MRACTSQLIGTASLSCGLSEYLLAASLFFYFTEDAISGLISVSFNILGLSSSTLRTLVVCCLIYLPAIIALFKDGHGINLFDSLLVLVLAASIFVLAYSNNPQNAVYFTRPVYGIDRVFRPDRAIYAYFIIRINQNNSALAWRSFRLSAVVLFFYWTAVLANSLRRGYWEDYDENGMLIRMRYNLTFGYAMMFPIAVFFFDKDGTINSLRLVSILIGVVEIFLAGSRGPLLCIAVMLAIELFRHLDKAWAWMTLLFVAFCILVVAIVGFDSILQQIKLILDSLNLSSRTLNRLLDGTISDENGRDFIWKASSEAIGRSPLFGYGVYGDRPLLVQYHFAAYPHNIVLEFAMQFGIPVTIVALSTLAVLSARILFAKVQRDDNWAKIFSVLFVVSCQLFLSMSFWYVSAFWAMLAAIVNWLSERGTKRRIFSN